MKVMVKYVYEQVALEIVALTVVIRHTLGTVMKFSDGCLDFLGNNL